MVNKRFKYSGESLSNCSLSERELALVPKQNLSAVGASDNLRFSYKVTKGMQVPKMAWPHTVCIKSTIFDRCRICSSDG